MVGMGKMLVLSTLRGAMGSGDAQATVLAQKSKNQNDWKYTLTFTNWVEEMKEIKPADVPGYCRISQPLTYKQIKAISKIQDAKVPLLGAPSLPMGMTRFRRWLHEKNACGGLDVDLTDDLETWLNSMSPLEKRALSKQLGSIGGHCSEKWTDKEVHPPLVRAMWNGVTRGVGKMLARKASSGRLSESTAPAKTNHRAALPRRGSRKNLGAVAAPARAVRKGKAGVQKAKLAKQPSFVRHKAQKKNAGSKKQHQQEESSSISKTFANIGNTMANTRDALAQRGEKMDMIGSKAERLNNQAGGLRSMASDVRRDAQANAEWWDEKLWFLRPFVGGLPEFEDEEPTKNKRK